MEKTRDETRDVNIDMLKGIAIILVVVGHFKPVGVIESFIYSFHMPLFMFLSGCTFYISFFKKCLVENRWQALWKYLCNRVLCLVVPFFSWCWLYNYFVLYDFNFLNAIRINFDRYWFLPTLAVLIFLFSFSEFFSEKTKCKKLFEFLFFTLSLVFLIICLKFFKLKIFRESIIYFIPFCMGLLITKYDLVRAIFAKNSTFTLCFILFCFLLPHYTIGDKSFFVLAVRFLTGILGSNIIYNFIYSLDFSHRTETGFSKVLCMLGGGTRCRCICCRNFLGVL